ncbi:putative lipase [Handroanthus impetiginosus]|uniref:Phospholipase A1 n=1 Tax=Handroanthus impetiginosus TaxID=429701 RepID=A0A2G9HLD1_9LAMI|nr:putative lipase [Handroanthus impetiginosus]
MAQATYDTFNSERLSKYAGSSRYSRRNLFSRVGLAKGNPFKYEAVKYIYATSSIRVPEAFILKPLPDDSWCRESNWMGYVAVATDEGKITLGRRDILVAWRGTIEPIEWVKDLDFPLVSASELVGRSGDNANVHKGFLSIYTSYNQHSTFNKTSARDQVISEVKKRVEQYKDEEISITVVGHSLGAALSTLNAADIVSNGYNKPRNRPNKVCPVTAFIFGSPLVGDLNFKNTLQSMHDLHILNLLNVPDVIPRLPPIGYSSVGVELWVDSRTSPYLNYPGDLLSWHNLEAAYLHPVALERGTTVKRDISLVNKNSAALKDKYSIPTNWWREKNKGMVQMNNGSWILQDHEKDD